MAEAVLAAEAGVVILGVIVVRVALTIHPPSPPPNRRRHAPRRPSFRMLGFRTRENFCLDDFFCEETFKALGVETPLRRARLCIVSTNARVSV